MHDLKSSGLGFLLGMFCGDSSRLDRKFVRREERVKPPRRVVD
jgi:hypothetical protein